MDGLAVAYMYQGKMRDAEELLKDTLPACYRAKKASRDLDVFDTLFKIAMCKVGVGNLANAEHLLRLILYGYLNDNGLFPRRLRGPALEIIQLLRHMYEKQQRWDDAESLGEWMEENTKYHPLHKSCRIRRWEVCENAVLRFCERGSTAKKHDASDIS
jgi:hypothetical protein